MQLPFTVRFRGSATDVVSINSMHGKLNDAQFQGQPPHSWRLQRWGASVVRAVDPSQATYLDVECYFVPPPRPKYTEASKVEASMLAHYGVANFDFIAQRVLEAHAQGLRL